MWGRFRRVMSVSRFSRSSPRMSHRSTPSSGRARNSSSVINFGGAVALIGQSPVPARILPGNAVDVTPTRPYSNPMNHTLHWTPPAGTAGLIFDCDGTLADTMPAHYKAWTAMLGRFNIPFPEPRFYAMGGMPTAQIIRVLAADAGVAVTDV